VLPHCLSHRITFIPPTGINCTGNVTNPHIELGLKWIGDNFERVFTDKGSNAPLYAVYGVERVGVASGRKYFGSVNWYERGADFLVKGQSKTGSWGNTIGTSFATLFLCRGRAPVLFNKLQYDIAGKEGNWNQRPRDIANLVRWIGRKTERDLNWQIVSLNGPVSELLDAPVLYISGNKPLDFTEEEQAKLREYCESGGLILGNADCGDQSFAESFKNLGTKLFHNYEFRILPSDHPIHTNQQFPRSTWKDPPNGSVTEQWCSRTDDAGPGRPIVPVTGNWRTPASICRSLNWPMTWFSTRSTNNICWKRERRLSSRRTKPSPPIA